MFARQRGCCREISKNPGITRVFVVRGHPPICTTVGPHRVGRDMGSYAALPKLPALAVNKLSKPGYCGGGDGLWLQA